MLHANVMWECKSGVARGPAAVTECSEYSEERGESEGEDYTM